jgi:hypothetical protein
MWELGGSVPLFEVWRIARAGCPGEASSVFGTETNAKTNR